MLRACCRDPSERPIPERRPARVAERILHRRVRERGVGGDARETREGIEDRRGNLAELPVAGRPEPRRGQNRCCDLP
eukprot:gene9760-biopygen4732